MALQQKEVERCTRKERGGAIRHLRAMKYSTIFPDSAAEPRAPRGRPALVRIPSSSRWTRPPFPSIATLSRSHDLYKNPPGVRLSVCVRACGGDGCVFPKATVMCSSIDDGGGKEGGGGVGGSLPAASLISVYLPVIYQDMSSTGSGETEHAGICARTSRTPATAW